MSKHSKALTPMSLDVLNPYIPTKRYLDGLISAVGCLSQHLTQQELEAIINDKLRLSDPKANESQFLQAAVELTVCAHFARYFPDYFVYEDKIRSPKDVDCSFRFERYKFNVEIKCADYSKKDKLESGEGMLFSALRRLNEFDSTYEQLSESFASVGTSLRKGLHMDNKLKDFLTSASGKFPEQPIFDELNILIVGCDGPFDIQKWESYLVGPQGLFTAQPYVQVNYDNVDLVVLTNLYHRHKDVTFKDKLEHHWLFSQAFSLLYLNPNSTKSFEVFRAFAATIHHFTDELAAHVVPGNAPDHVKHGIAIRDFVGRELTSKRRYYFQPPKSAKSCDAGADPLRFEEGDRAIVLL